MPQPKIFLSTPANRTFKHPHGKFFHVYIDFDSLFLEAVLDTDAFSSAMSLIKFEKIRSQCPHLVKSQIEIITKRVKMADATSVSISVRCSLIISIGGQTFQESFLVLPQLNSTLLGMHFFKNHETVFHPSKGLLYLHYYNFTLSQKNTKTIEKNYILKNFQGFVLQQINRKSQSANYTMKMP